MSHSSKKSLLLFGVLSVNVFFATPVFAGNFQGPDAYARDWSNRSQFSSQAPSSVSDDSQLVSAVHGRRDVYFVQAANVVVTRILLDDTQGLQHQRWYVRLSDGSSVFAVYNIDMSARVPVEVNEVMSLGGQFKMTNQGPLMHWLHQDPQHNRPDGYVDVNGERYGKINNN